MFFGDSITQHGFETEYFGWLIILNKWWIRRADILNRGFSGYCTRWAKHAVDDVVISERPSLLFVFFGANDATDKQFFQHVPLDEYKANLAFIAKRARRAFGEEFPIALITPPPIWEPKLEIRNKDRGLPLDRSNVKALLYVNAVKEVGNELNIPVLDSWTLLEGNTDNRALYLHDGLHLNQEGNSKLADATKKFIQKNFPQLTPEVLNMHLPDHSAIPDEWKI